MQITELPNAKIANNGNNTLEGKNNRGMPTFQARAAMLGLITVLVLLLVITIINPSVVNSRDDLVPVIKHNPLLFYLITTICIGLTVYIGFLRKCV